MLLRYAIAAAYNATGVLKCGEPEKVTAILLAPRVRLLLFFRERPVSWRTREADQSRHSAVRAFGYANLTATPGISASVAAVSREESTGAVIRFFPQTGAWREGGANRSQPA